jgi:hypothetical protein
MLGKSPIIKASQSIRLPFSMQQANQNHKHRLSKRLTIILTELLSFCNHLTRLAQNMQKRGHHISATASVVFGRRAPAPITLTCGWRSNQWT